MIHLEEKQKKFSVGPGCESLDYETLDGYPSTLNSSVYP